MSSVLIERKGAIAYLILNRPSKLNVLDYGMSVELRNCAAELRNDESVKCVIVSGAGDHFMAGGDLAYFKGLIDEYAIDGESAYPKDIFDNVHSAIRDIVSMEKPVVACAKGAVAGFGLSLLLSCDIVFAAEECVFSVAYCKIGTTPDGGMTYFLPRAVGQKKAMELMMTGDIFTAQQALSWGMLNKVVPTGEVAAVADGFAEKLCEGPSKVLSRTKQLLNDTFDVSLDNRLDEEANNFQTSMREADFAEGVTSFIEKRPAKFLK